VVFYGFYNGHYIKKFYIKIVDILFIVKYNIIMNLGYWPSLNSSPCMSDIRKQLKKKPAPGEPTPSRKEANRTWRECFLGHLPEKDKKARNQQKKFIKNDENHDDLY
jgi:hypothetical protein